MSKKGNNRKGGKASPVTGGGKKGKSGTNMFAVVAVAIAIVAFLGSYLLMTPRTKSVDQALAEVRQEEESYIKANSQWLEDNKTKPGVVVLPSGLQYKVITEGKGKVAQMNDDVTVRYEGKLIDGTVFDSSYKRNPDIATFKPSQVVKGWTEALCMMPEGSKWELYVPRDLGYGGRAAGAIKPFSTLIFTIEVVSVTPAE